MKRKIREIRTFNPKEFWKIINSKDRKKKVTNVNLDELFDFFKDLNTNQNDDILDRETPSQMPCTGTEIDLCC